MIQSTRPWLPAYCDRDRVLPFVLRPGPMFSLRPFLFQDFAGKALAFLGSEVVRDLGFVYDPATALPCKWKCSDESLFGVDLCLYAYTGAYPFDKGKIGGFFNPGSVGAAVHHAPTNIDFGGSHVGFAPDPHGARFGQVERPRHPGESSTDCGYMCALLAPFQEVYRDACENIQLWSLDSEVIVSVPNEFLQPAWSSGRIKLLVDLETLSAGPVFLDDEKQPSLQVAGRSLFRVPEKFLAKMSPEDRQRFNGPTPQPIGHALRAKAFHIFDSKAELRPDGTPIERVLPYMRYILATPEAPAEVAAAVVSANIEHNRLADTVRLPTYRAYAFASFTGVFLDTYDPISQAYVNLFQPIGLTIKPAGHRRETEFSVAQIHEMLTPLEPAKPLQPLENVLGYKRPGHLLEQYSFQA